MGQTSTKAGAVVWGSSEHGQLGIGSLPAEDRAVSPRLIEGLRNIHVRHVACSGHYSCAVAESGDVYSWGYGKDGQLGHGNNKDAFTPKVIRGLQSKMIRSVSCAEHHVAAVSDTGALWTWGRGQNGRLGHGGAESELFPKVVEALVGNHVVQASCGDFHTACVTLNPMQVYTWGLGLSGRLGHGDETDCNLPTPVDALSGPLVSCVACGGHHSAAVVEPSGHLMTWGGGAFGKLGHGNRLAQTVPKLVAALQAKKLVSVSLGPHHSAALTQKGEVYTWGQSGRLGHASHGAEVDEMLPRQVAALAGVFVVQVSGGHSHCAVVTETGDVWAWGASRAFGHTEPTAVPGVPTMIKVLSGKAIVQVACAVTHTIALSDYRRLAGKAAMVAARSTASAAVMRDRIGPLGVPGAGRLDSAEELLPGAQAPDERAGGGALPEHRLGELGDGGSVRGAPEKSQMMGKSLLPALSMDREVAFLNAELKAYQEQSFRMARQLQETKTKLEALQNENSFLRSELEVMHQCSDDADERVDTLRKHFNDRLKEMERRHAERERAFRESFGRLRLQMEGAAAAVSAASAATAATGGEAEGAGAAVAAAGRPEGSAAVLGLGGEAAASAEGPAAGGEDGSSTGAAPSELAAGGDWLGDAARGAEGQRGRPAGPVSRVSSLWPAA